VNRALAITGAENAISYRINPVIAPVLGMISGIGGGMTRDVLAGDIPFVLRKDPNAIAAPTAGVIVTIGSKVGFGTARADAPRYGGLHLPSHHGDLFGWRTPVSP
jgi:uncharacterized membrane protein YeiH